MCESLGETTRGEVPFAGVFSPFCVAIFFPFCLVFFSRWPPSSAALARTPPKAFWNAQSPTIPPPEGRGVATRRAWGAGQRLGAQGCAIHLRAPNAGNGAALLSVMPGPTRGVTCGARPLVQWELQ